MRRLVIFVLLLVPGAAFADSPAPDSYLGGGVTGGGIDGYEYVQGFVDGGSAIVERWLWLHARLAAGTLDDTEADPPWPRSHKIASVVVGIEARSCVRFVCAVGGLDLGGMEDFYRASLDPAFHLHLGLEIGLGDSGMAFRVELGADPGPGASAGLLMRL